MDSDALNRIALVVTIAGSLFIFAQLTVVSGWVGLFGILLSLAIVAAVLVLWSKVRSD